jgi:DNA (cytosine-5)-methyltransferase 1
MRPVAYYNEHDARKAAWLRHLIEEGAIAHGVVDERSITEVQPDDLAGYTQCHFFAGIGVWSYALRLAGWPDDRPVWTGSCPCGPFSVAGKKLGFADPRHLWPAWLPLIRERRPDVLFGEQSDDADAWVDLVSTDLEDLGYAFGAPDIPAAGFGGAHIRQRFYWVADADNAEWWSERAPWHDGHWPKTGRVQGDRYAGDGGAGGWLGHASGYRPAANARNDGEMRGVQEAQRQPEHGPALSGGSGPTLGMGGATGGRCRVGPGGVGYIYEPDRSSPLEWIFGRDGLWRPVEPGLSPLTDAAPARMGRLRGYGDAIDAEAAANFIGAYLDSAPAERSAA